MATAGMQRLPNVAHIINVASGKGGVGKSTVATNLAVSLAARGLRVGILDADIYGPSTPLMMGLAGEKPLVDEAGKAIPLERHGVKVMSMGFMLDDNDAVVWRGPMLGRAVQQFIDDVAWGPLDALVVDMPPGTGDVQLSLSQLLAVAGSVVVTTPQDVAFADVRRAIKMFSMTKTEVIGLVENMSGFTCTSCGTEHQIFGSGNLEAHAAEAGLDILARIPMDGVTAVAADGGEPIVVAAPDGAAATAYRTLAENLWTRLNADTTEGLEERFPSFFDMKQG